MPTIQTNNIKWEYTIPWAAFKRLLTSTLKSISVDTDGTIRVEIDYGAVAEIAIEQCVTSATIDGEAQTYTPAYGRQLAERYPADVAQMAIILGNCVISETAKN